MMNRVELCEPREETNFAGKVELAVKRLDVLQRVSSNQLLVQPDLVVRRGTRQEMLGDSFRKIERLAV